MDDFDWPLLSLRIFGWEIHRVFRSENKTILKIQLIKDGQFLELVNNNACEGSKTD